MGTGKKVILPPYEVSILDFPGSTGCAFGWRISPAGAGDKLMNAKLRWKVNTRTVQLGTLLGEIYGGFGGAAPGLY